jgi:hypothetical protein
MKLFTYRYTVLNHRTSGKEVMECNLTMVSIPTRPFLISRP